MRTALKLVSDTGGGASDVVEIKQVQCDMWRDWFLRIDVSNSTVTVKAYTEEQHARLGNDEYISSGTGSTGADQTITLTAQAGADFDPGGFKVTTTVAGTVTSAVFVFTAAVVAYLLAQIERILKEYKKENEALSEVAQIIQSTAFAEPLFPIVALTGSSGIGGGGSNRTFHIAAEVSIYVFTHAELHPTAYGDALRLAEQIKSIAADEQRVWGDMATYTEIAGDVTPTPGTAELGEDEGLPLWISQVIVRVGFPEIDVSRAVNYPHAGDTSRDTGGKYAEDYK